MLLINFIDHFDLKLKVGGAFFKNFKGIEFLVA